MKSLLTWFLLVGICSAQHLVKKETFDAIANEYSGERAQENIRSIVEYSRIQGSPMMASVASDVVLGKLKALGIESKVEQWDSDGKKTYGTYISPMGWDMRGGELWVESAGGDKNFQPCACAAMLTSRCASSQCPKAGTGRASWSRSAKEPARKITKART